MPPAAQTDDTHVVSQDTSKGCDSQPGQQSPACSATAQDTGNSFYGRRMVFYNVAENKTEPELLQLFSQHGVVADMFIVRSALGTSSGCGYVTFAAGEQASAALKALQGSTDCAEYGTSLGVLMVQEGMPPGSNSASRTSSGASSAAAAVAAAAADDARSTASLSPKAAAQQEQTKSGKAVFFTKVPPTVTSQQLIQLFSSCGDVAHLELFIPWPGAKISRGCGLVEFACSKAAASAVHSLHQLFTWPHSHSALVVEWVDRNRQSNNSKGNKGRTGHGAVSNGHPHMGSPGSMGPGLGGHHMRAVDQQMGAGGAYGWRPAHAGAGHGIMPHHQLMQAQLAGQQGRNSNSCPLPQLPPGWQVVSTSQQLSGGAGGASAARVGMVAAAPQWASVPTPLINLGGHRVPQPQQACAVPTPVYLQQQQPQMQHDGSALGLQQQQLLAHQQQLACSSDGNTMAWLACPATTALSNTSVDLTSYASLGSVYDASMMSSSNFSSTANSAANSGVLQAGGQQQQQTKVMISAQDLTACSASPSHSVGSISAPMQYQQDAMMAVPAANGATMAAGGAAAAAANGNDAIYQQLLQQHVLLFQNMTPPSEDEGMAQQQQQQLLLPTSAGVQQQGGMLMTAAGGLSYAPMSQAQQLSPSQVVYSNSSLPSPAHQQHTGWWSMQQAATPQQVAPQQQQQVPVATSGDSNTAVLALPLSQRQLAAMAGVLPEVHKLTGAQAWISTATNGGLQLCLSGNHMQLNNGHAAVATLLSRAGVEEQLATPMVHAAAN